MTGTDSATPVKADARKTFVGGEALQFVFRDRERSRTVYQVCHRSSRGRSCRNARSAAKGEASPFPPLLANTDVLGAHRVVWLVEGRVVARAEYAVTPEGDDGSGNAQQPTTTGNFEGDNVGCATFRSSKGVYTVQYQGFTASPGPGCAQADETVRTYLDQHAPGSATVGGYRCSMAKGGDAASGTFGKVTCTTAEPGQIIGLYRGT